MDLTGEERIAAPREAVWKVLNDPDILKTCIPGCESLEWVSDTALDATIAVKLGLIKARFYGRLELSNLNPPQSYTLTGEGKGSIAGFAKGGADIRLIEDGSETVLVYTILADVSGKLAQLGGRLIASAASKLASRFFANLATAASGQLPETETPA